MSAVNVEGVGVLGLEKTGGYLTLTGPNGAVWGITVLEDGSLDLANTRSFRGGITVEPRADNRITVRSRP